LLLAKTLTTALLAILKIWIFISFLFIFQQSNSIKYIQQQLKLNPDFIQRYLFVSSLLNLIEEISARKTEQYVNQNINSKNVKNPSNVRNFFSRLRKKLSI
jgi:predicted Holliday junction resolvase-like endonuclease